MYPVTLRTVLIDALGAALIQVPLDPIVNFFGSNWRHLFMLEFILAVVILETYTIVAICAMFNVEQSLKELLLNI